MNPKMSKAVYFPLIPCLLGLSMSSYAPLLASMASSTVPEKLQVSAGESLLLKAQAKGVQIYQCKAKAENPKRWEWSLKAPKADLFDDKGEKIGKHYGGPTWEANDGSKVVGEVKERANSPEKDAIPWLLLTAKSHEGKGIFSKVTSIQRLDTSGGKAPSTGCDESKKNAEVQVGYGADYYFFSN